MRLHLGTLDLTFEVFEFGADLFLCKSFKLLMNLTCVRKNRWDKSQLLLRRNLSIEVVVVGGGGDINIILILANIYIYIYIYIYRF